MPREALAVGLLVTLLASGCAWSAAPPPPPMPTSAAPGQATVLTTVPAAVPATPTMQPWAVAGHRPPHLPAYHDSRPDVPLPCFPTEPETDRYRAYVDRVRQAYGEVYPQGASNPAVRVEVEQIALGGDPCRGPVLPIATIDEARAYMRALQAGERVTR